MSALTRRTAALLALIAPRIALAQSREPRPVARLAWQVTEPACADSAAFRASLAARLGDDPFDDASANVVTVTSSRAGERLTLQLDVRDADGRSLGARSFSGRARSCDELLSSAAVTLQLVFDPSGELAQRARRDALLLPPPAPPPPPPTPAPPPSERRIVTDPPREVAPLVVEPLARGVELSTRFGYGALQDTSNAAFVTSFPQGSPFANLGGGFDFDAIAGLRVHPNLSFGMRGGYQQLAGTDENARASAWWLGAYARVYLAPSTRPFTIDPWVSVGVDLAAHLSNYTRAAIPTTFATWTLKARTLPLSAGFDVNVARGFALGVWGSASLWFPYEACVDGPIAICYQRASGDLFLPVQFDMNVLWQIGGSLRYTIGW